MTVIRRSWPDRGDSPEGKLSEVFERYWQEYDDDKALELTRRWAVAFGGYDEAGVEEQVILYSARGYSQGDWWDVFVAVEPGYGSAEGYAEEWEQWARGDVYMIQRERFEACGLEGCEDDPEEEETHWVEDADWLGGIYSDDAEDAVKYYEEGM